MEYNHKSVLLDECIDGLSINPGGIYVDCTLGGAGHSLEIARRLGPGGLLLGIDQDAAAIARGREVLAEFSGRCRMVHASFFDIGRLLAVLGISAVDGFLVDLGVSSHQLDEPSRGFSYMHDAPLDMRMDPRQTLSAHTVVNTYEEERLADLLESYGEERWAKRIAEFIVAARPIDTTAQLVSIIKKAIPAAARAGGPHPAKRSFQAIRIEVNRELSPLAQAIDDMAHLLRPGGRLCIISFHSLEDRIAKTTIRGLEGGQCSCPRGLPVCVCRPTKLLQNITRKPITPSQAELDQNHRARSAKLRIAERVD